MKFKGRNIRFIRLGQETCLKNDTNCEAMFFSSKEIKIKKGLTRFSFTSAEQSDDFKICLVTRKMRVLYNFDVNTDVYINLSEDFVGRILIRMKPNCNAVLTKWDIGAATGDYLLEYFNSENLLVSPGYPSVGDRYNCGFVHTRALAYKDSGFSCDTIWVGDFYETTVYDYQGIRVVRMNFGDFRELLYLKKYKRILIHFFNEKMAKVIENLCLVDTKLYFYAHGAETLYRDWKKICCPYFQTDLKLTTELYDLFDEKDRVIKKFNDMPNAKWIFVTNWTRQRSEELVGVHYNNYDVIPCLVDTSVFPFRKKDPELRKKIFMLRKFHDVNSYSIDLDVRTILELSHRAFFKDLEFNIYGDGPLHDVLLAPVRQFENVKIHKHFLTAKEISEMHQKHGIALFATRFDSQAVSSCEAASSGCVVVSTLNPGILQEFDAEHGTLCNQEHYKEYADVIEQLYYNPDEFVAISEKMSQKIHQIYDFEHTIAKELKIFAQDSAELLPIKPLVGSHAPLLSVVIPAYNVQKYVVHTIWSLINQRNADKIEVLVVNDGSKDRTVEVVRDFAKKYDPDEKVIKIIDKENGGHGSVLNCGVNLARGKYFKIIDGDDTVDSEAFAKLIDLLQNEDCDIILNNYCLDLPYSNSMILQEEYTMLAEGIEYRFEDLCYQGYGFNMWGPLLSTSTYKLSMIRKRPFHITEKMFYDDMEWNLNIYINCETVKFYKLNIYNYLIGRAGQSISNESLIRNHAMHRQMVGNLLKIYHQNLSAISANKRRMIDQKIVKKMIHTHYNLIFDLVQSAQSFVAFDSIVKQYPDFYNDPEICGRKTRFLRKTKGHFMSLQKIPAALRNKKELL